jgi:hypothetical protein
MREPHLDRAGPDRLGPVPAQYDRYRPTYANALLDDLVALPPPEVLDVGCGIGSERITALARQCSVHTMYTKVKPNVTTSLRPRFGWPRWKRARRRWIQSR